MDVTWLGTLNGVHTSFSSPTGGPQKLMKGPFFGIALPLKQGAGNALSGLARAKPIKFLKST